MNILYQGKKSFDIKEIKEFKPLVFEQLEILFLYRQFLTFEHRNCLQKIIRFGDTNVLKFF